MLYRWSFHTKVAQTWIESVTQKCPRQFFFFFFFFFFFLEFLFNDRRLSCRWGGRVQKCFQNTFLKEERKDTSDAAHATDLTVLQNVKLLHGRPNAPIVSWIEWRTRENSQTSFSLFFSILDRLPLFLTHSLFTENINLQTESLAPHPLLIILSNVVGKSVKLRQAATNHATDKSQSH